jgi:hypothetical protein
VELCLLQTPGHVQLDVEIHLRRGIDEWLGWG